MKRTLIEIQTELDGLKEDVHVAKKQRKILKKERKSALKSLTDQGEIEKEQRMLSILGPYLSEEWLVKRRLHTLLVEEAPEGGLYFWVLFHREPGNSEALRSLWYQEAKVKLKRNMSLGLTMEPNWETDYAQDVKQLPWPPKVPDHEELTFERLWQQALEANHLVKYEKLREPLAILTLLKTIAHQYPDKFIHQGNVLEEAFGLYWQRAMEMVNAINKKKKEEPLVVI